MSTPPPPQGSNAGPAVAAAGIGMGVIIALVVAGCGGIAVIGILAAIAIPNFIMFQCKSMQSEAKTELSGLFTSQKAFYGEYNFYTSDLVSVDWAPFGSPRYVYGFAQAGPEEDTLPRSVGEVPRDYDPSRNDTANAAVISSQYSTTNMKDKTGRTLTGKDLPYDTYADASGFVAGAAGDIDTDSPTRLDVWTIDQNKTIRNVENDCTN